MNARTLPALLALSVSLSFLAACNTSEPGVKNNMGTLSRTVEAKPQEVTETAVDVLKDLDLLKVSSTATQVDGVATAETASGTKIKVMVSRVDDTHSKISARAGAVWDTDLSMTVLNRIYDEIKPEKSEDK